MWSCRILGFPTSKKVNRVLLQWAKEFKLPTVATNDVHYIEREHWEAHDCLICLQTQTQVTDAKRMRYVAEQFYLRTPEEMHQLFAEVPEALKNTLEVAEKCSFKFKFGKLRFPVYFPPDEMSREKYLRQLVEQGLRDRYGIDLANPKGPDEQAVIDRVEFELKIIDKTGFISYFLIVWDFVHYAKSQGIPVGPGRGSALPWQHGGVFIEDHRYRSAAVQAALRAILESRTRFAARYRYGFLLQPAAGSH